MLQTETQAVQTQRWCSLLLSLPHEIYKSYWVQTDCMSKSTLIFGFLSCHYYQSIDKVGFDFWWWVYWEQTDISRRRQVQNIRTVSFMLHAFISYPDYVKIHSHFCFLFSSHYYFYNSIDTVGWNLLSITRKWGLDETFKWQSSVLETVILFPHKFPRVKQEAPDFVDRDTRLTPDPDCKCRLQLQTVKVKMAFVWKLESPPLPSVSVPTAARSKYFPQSSVLQ